MVFRVMYRRACLLQRKIVSYAVNGVCAEVGELAECVPLGLVLGKDLPLGVVADDLDVDEGTNVQLLRPEHRHLGGCGRLPSSMVIPRCMRLRLHSCKFWDVVCLPTPN